MATFKVLRKAVATVWGYKQGEMSAMMIHVADRLGLFKTLADMDAHEDRAEKEDDDDDEDEDLTFFTTDEVAKRTGYHRRWLMELLRGLTAAKILKYREGDDETEGFRLPPEMVEVLANDEDSLLFAAGAFVGSGGGGGGGGGGVGAERPRLERVVAAATALRSH